MGWSRSLTILQQSWEIGGFIKNILEFMILLILINSLLHCIVRMYLYSQVQVPSWRIFISSIPSSPIYHHHQPTALFIVLSHLGCRKAHPPHGWSSGWLQHPGNKNIWSAANIFYISSANVDPSGCARNWKIGSTPQLGLAGGWPLHFLVQRGRASGLNLPRICIIANIWI